MMRPFLIPVLLLIAACSVSVGAPPSFEVIEEPVDFYFDTDSRDRSRVGNVAETLEPHFPEMSWRIGTYEPSDPDGIVVVVEERQLRGASEQNRACRDCLRFVTVFVIYDQGRRLGTEEFEDCRIYGSNDDCFAVRRLVSTIDTQVGGARSEERGMRMEE